MIRYLKEIRNRRDQPHPLRVFRRIHYTFYLTVVFVFIKLLYAANVVGQLFFVNIFLGTDFHLYGIDVITRIANGADWTTSNRFPRVAICDFKMRVLHNIHDHTVLCALPMNLYNEMLFIFLWFWLVVVSAVTVGSLIYWIAVVVGIRQQVNFVRPRLAAMGKLDPVDIGTSAIGKSEKRCGMHDTSNFVRSYLMRDGCLIVRLVAENTNDLIAADLLSRLYDDYTQQTTVFGGPQPPSIDVTCDYGTSMTSCDGNCNGMSPMPVYSLSSPHHRLTKSSSQLSFGAAEMNIKQRIEYNSN